MPLAKTHEEKRMIITNQIQLWNNNPPKTVPVKISAFIELEIPYFNMNLDKTRQSIINEIEILIMYS